MLNGSVGYHIFNFAKGGQLEAYYLKYAYTDGVCASVAIVVISAIAFCPNGVDSASQAKLEGNYLKGFTLPLVI